MKIESDMHLLRSIKEKKKRRGNTGLMLRCNSMKAVEVLLQFLIIRDLKLHINLYIYNLPHWN